MASSPSLTLKRRIKASPEKVYEAWTRPEKMIQWWGVYEMGGGKTPVAEADVRVGGRFKLNSWMPNGQHNSVSGAYTAVEPNRKLAFSWAWQSTPDRVSQVTIDFKPDGDATMLTLTHEQFFDEKARDGHRGGWSAALDNLERVFP